MRISSILDEFKSIDKIKLTETKAHANPPIIIANVLESVLILLGKEPTFSQARRLLGRN